MIFLWLGIAALTAIIAASKGRSFFAWLILGMLFSVLSLIAVCAMPQRN